MLKTDNTFRSAENGRWTSQSTMRMKDRIIDNQEWILSKTLKDLFEEGLNKIRNMENHCQEVSTTVAMPAYYDNEDWKDVFIEPLQQIRRPENAWKKYYPIYAQ